RHRSRSRRSNLPVSANRRASGGREPRPTRARRASNPAPREPVPRFTALRPAAIDFEPSDARRSIAAAEAEAYAAARSGAHHALGGDGEGDLAVDALGAELRALCFRPWAVGAAGFERAERDARATFTLESDCDGDVGVVGVRDVHGDFRIGLEGERAVVAHLGADGAIGDE